jgi:metacaspase-1
MKFTKALLIGINYIGTRYELRGCHNDVDNIRNLLIKNGTKEENIIVLKEATRLDILRTFIRFVMMSKSDDVLYLHYSGHGISKYDASKDELDGHDELIFTADLKEISDEELNRYLVDSLPPDTKLFTVFDCCHSGTILDLRYNITYITEPSLTSQSNGTSQPGHYVITHDNSTNKNLGNVICLSGSMDHQYATDAHIQNSYQGALTYCLIETIGELGGFRDLLQVLKEVNLKLIKYGFVNQKSILSTNGVGAFS